MSAVINKRKALSTQREIGPNQTLNALTNGCTWYVLSYSIQNLMFH